MGAIDARGQWINRGHVIKENLFFAVGNHEAGGCNSASLLGCDGVREAVPLNCSALCIYVDWIAPSFRIESNVFWQPTPTKTFGDGGLHAIFLNGGRDHTVSGNMFVGNFTSAVWMNPIGLQGSPGSGIGDPGFVKEFRNMHDVQYRQPPYSTHYPKLAAVHDFVGLPLIGNCSLDPLCPAAPFGNVYRSNVVVNVSDALVEEAPAHSCVNVTDGTRHNEGMPPAAFILPRSATFSRSNFDIQNNWLASDPGWSDLRLNKETGPCMGLRADAHAFKMAPGFAPIPTADIGTAAFQRRLGCGTKTDDEMDLDEKAKTKHLFVDYSLFESWRNVSLRVGRPAKGGAVLMAEHPWERFMVGSFSGVIQRAPRDLLMYYCCQWELFRAAVCVAQSEDGLVWHKPMLTARKWQGGPSNIVFPPDPYANNTYWESSGGAFYDPLDEAHPIKITGVWSAFLNGGEPTPFGPKSGNLPATNGVRVLSSVDGFIFDTQHYSSTGAGALNPNSTDTAYGPQSDTGNMCVRLPPDAAPNKYACYIRYDEPNTAPGVSCSGGTEEPAARRIGRCETAEIGRWCTERPGNVTCTDKTPTANNSCEQVWPRPANDTAVDPGFDPSSAPCMDFYNASPLIYEGVTFLFPSVLYHRAVAYENAETFNLSAHHVWGNDGMMSFFLRRRPGWDLATR
jgi:hypothetical protein